MWQRDPVTAGRPFPDVRLLDRITAQTCPAAPFPASAAGQVGTGPQRAYAVLRGLGATAHDREPAAMARLAAGQVQVDPDLGSRGPGSLGLEVAWRKLPAPACPRPFPSSVGIDGV